MLLILSLSIPVRKSRRDFEYLFGYLLPNSVVILLLVIFNKYRLGYHFYLRDFFFNFSSKSPLRSIINNQLITPYPKLYLEAILD